MTRAYLLPRRAMLFIVALAYFGCPAPLLFAANFSVGDLVRLTRSETLTFEEKYFQGASKGQEFSVLKYDAVRQLVYVPFFKEDGSLVAVTLPADALESSPPDAWTDLYRGAEAFRDQRPDDARRLLVRAAQDPQYRSIAAALSTRIQSAITAGTQARSSPAAARQVASTAAQGLRDAAEQLSKLGYLSLALRLDEGADRWSAQIPGAPATAAALAPSKLERADLSKRVATSDLAVARCRQAIGLRRLTEASQHLDEGLKAEPERPELKAFQTRVRKDLEEAQGRYEDAERMRRFPKGTIHALTAIEMGLKVCADHPKLRALKKEMHTEFEERTAPPVTPVFLAAARVKTPPQDLAEGHRLYTNRCAECHDLELLDSRSLSGWQKAVSGMARRAHLSATEQAHILDYLAAAQNGLDSTP